MGEVGGVVPTVQAMVGLVVGGSSKEGQQSVQTPGKIIAAMVLHRQPAVEKVEEGFTHGVAAHHPSTAQSQQQLREQLRGAGILGCQGEGDLVLMVQLVDVSVQPGNPKKKHKQN